MSKSGMTENDRDNPENSNNETHSAFSSAPNAPPVPAGMTESEISLVNETEKADVIRGNGKIGSSSNAAPTVVKKETVLALSESDEDYDDTSDTRNAPIDSTSEEDVVPWEFPDDFMEIPALQEIWKEYAIMTVPSNKPDLESYENIEDVYAESMSKIKNNFNVTTVLNEFHFLLALMTKLRSNEITLNEALWENNKTLEEMNHQHLNDTRVLRALELARNWREQLAKVEQQNTNLTSTVNNLKENVENLNVKIGNTYSNSHQLAQSMKKASALTDQVGDLEYQKKNLMRKIEKQRSMLRSYEGQTYEEEHAKRLHCEAEFISKDMALSNLEHQTLKLKKNRQTLTQEKEELQGLITKMQTKIEARKCATKLLEKELQNLKNSMMSSEREIRNLRSDKSLGELKQTECNQKIKSLGQQQRLMEFQREMTEKDKREIEIESSKISADVKVKHNRIKALETSISEMKGIIHMQAKNLDRISIEATKANNEVTSLKAENEVLRAKTWDADQIKREARKSEKIHKQLMMKAKDNRRNLEHAFTASLDWAMAKDEENVQLLYTAHNIRKDVDLKSNHIEKIEAELLEEQEKVVVKNNWITEVKEKQHFLEYENAVLGVQAKSASKLDKLQVDLLVMTLVQETKEQLVHTANTSAICALKEVALWKDRAIDRDARLKVLALERDKLKEDVAAKINAIELQKTVEPRMKNIIQYISKQLEGKDKEITEILYQRDVFAVKLVHRNTEVELLRMKMAVMDRILAKGQESYQSRVLDIRILKLEIKRLKKEVQMCERSKATPNLHRKYAMKFEQRWCLEACKRKNCEDLYAQQFTTLRFLKCRDRSQYDMFLKLHRLTKMLIGKTDELVACEEELHQKTVCLSQLKKTECRRQDVSISPQLSQARAVIRAKTSALKAITAENNMNRCQLKKAEEKKVRGGKRK